VRKELLDLVPPRAKRSPAQILQSLGLLQDDNWESHVSDKVELVFSVQSTPSHRERLGSAIKTSPLARV
jgi:hypothetical protein